MKRIILAVCFVFFAADLRAADPKPTNTALDKVPATTEVFHSTLRLGETLELIGKSRAWQTLWSEPVVQDFWKKLLAGDVGGADAPKNEFKEFLANPKNLELLMLVKELASQEMFVAASDWSDLITTYKDIYSKLTTEYIDLIKEKGEEEAKAIMGDRVLKSLNKNTKVIKIPNTLIGFKAKDSALLQGQLKRFKSLAEEALKDHKVKLETVKVGNDEFLTIKLKGSMIPANVFEEGLEQFGKKPGDYPDLFKAIDGLTLQISLGFRDGYLLLAFGPSTDSILQFGGKGDKLVGHKDLAPVQKYADKPLLSVTYMNDKARSLVSASLNQYLMNYVQAMRTVLVQANLSKELEKAVEKELAELTKTLEAAEVKPGAETSFSYRTANGWESLSYDYTPSKLPAAKPLTIIDQLGGDPIFATAWRSHTTVEDFKNLVKWAERVGELGLKALKEQGKEDVIDQYTTKIFPVLKSFVDITEKLWLPALADGQEAFVIGVGPGSKQWHPAMPESEKPQSFPSPAVVLGVSDSAKLEQALGEYRGLLNKILGDPLAGANQFNIPLPKTEKKGAIKLAYYDVPEQAGVDAKLRPTGGLTSSFAAISLFGDHTEKLLTKTPYKVESKLTVNSSRPLDSMMVFNFEGFIKMVRPWVDYAIANNPNQANTEKVKEIVPKVMDYLGVFKRYTSISYRENGATIRHSEAIFADIPKK